MSKIHFNTFDGSIKAIEADKRAGAVMTAARTELAQRSNGGIDVTLLWVPGDGDGDAKVVVCVCDRKNGAYFEIPAEPYLALDVYYHPFFYRDFSTIDYADTRLAA